MLRLCYAWIWVLGLPLLRLLAFFVPKWKTLYEGRHALNQCLRHAQTPTKGPVLWIHAASLGEFEQIRPLIEHIRNTISPLKECFIWLSFFSPSGYEIRKNYALVNQVSYLPFDRTKAVCAFLDVVQPRWVLLVKSEWWPELLRQLSQRSISVFSVCTRWHPTLLFAHVLRDSLQSVQHFYTQDSKTLDHLQRLGFNCCTHVGDTRYDRVWALAHQSSPIEIMKAWTDAHAFVMVWGSLWMSDWRRARAAINALGKDWKHIIVPHEPTEAFMRHIESDLKDNTIRYGVAKKEDVKGMHCLIIDRVGLLGRLYAYARVAYVGGGFRGALHNILEPAAYGCPVVFGSCFRSSKFPEAGLLQKSGGACAVNSPKQLIAVLHTWCDENQHAAASKAALASVQHAKGATHRLATGLLPKLT